MILAFRRNGVVTAATKGTLRPVLSIAERIAWVRLEEKIRIAKDDQPCG
jgi:hypothetical protein